MLCLQICNFPFPDRKEWLGNTLCQRHATQPTPISSVFISIEPTNSTGRILRRLRSLEVKFRPNCLGRSWIHLQNGQRDNFTHEPPCFHTNNFGVPITVKSSLTSRFFQKFSSTHHSRFMMPAWELLQWKVTPKILINHKITRFELMCSLTEQATAKY